MLEKSTLPHTPSPEISCLDNGCLIFTIKSWSTMESFEPLHVLPLWCVNALKNICHPFIMRWKIQFCPSFFAAEAHRDLLFSVPLPLDLVWILWNSCLTLLSQKRVHMLVKRYEFDLIKGSVFFPCISFCSWSLALSLPRMNNEKFRFIWICTLSPQ